MGVVGGGLMGSGIAEMGARAGIDTVVVEVDGDAAVRARQRVEASMARALRSAKLTEEAVESARGLLRYTADYEALRDRELIVEAVFEAESEKIKAFSALDRMVDSPSVILASNTSSIPIMKLAMATQRPASVIGIHFFNPVPVLKLVELVTSLLTADETAARAEAFATGQLGKLVIRSRDRAGFIVNALLIPYLLSAVRMLESPCLIVFTKSGFSARIVASQRPNVPIVVLTAKELTDDDRAQLRHATNETVMKGTAAASRLIRAISRLT